MARIGERAAGGALDPFSSAATLDGWRGLESEAPRVTSAPHTWLLAAGWRRRGLLSADEMPGQPAEAWLPVGRAAIEEAHALGLRVAVHATELETARIALRAGADVLVHSVVDADVDDDFVPAAPRARRAVRDDARRLRGLRARARREGALHPGRHGTRRSLRVELP